MITITINDGGFWWGVVPPQNIHRFLKQADYTIFCADFFPVHNPAQSPSFSCVNQKKMKQHKEFTYLSEYVHIV